MNKIKLQGVFTTFCMKISLSEFNILTLTSHSTVFHCQFQLWFNKVRLTRGELQALRGVGAGVRGSRVAKGVIIPRGVAYCCLSLCDKTKRTGLGSYSSVLRLLFWRLTMFWQVVQSIMGIILRIKFVRDKVISICKRKGVWRLRRWCFESWVSWHLYGPAYGQQH